MPPPVQQSEPTAPPAPREFTTRELIAALYRPVNDREFAEIQEALADETALRGGWSVWMPSGGASRTGISVSSSRLRSTPGQRNTIVSRRFPAGSRPVAGTADSRSGEAGLHRPLRDDLQPPPDQLGPWPTQARPGRAMQPDPGVGGMVLHKRHEYEHRGNDGSDCRSVAAFQGQDRRCVVSPLHTDGVFAQMYVSGRLV